MRTIEDHETFILSLVDAANTNMKLMDGTTGPVEQIVAAADVVYAAWQDKDWPYGIGYLLVKGRAWLKNIADKNYPALPDDRVNAGGAVLTSHTAILVNSYATAIALMQLFGDNAPVNAV